MPFLVYAAILIATIFSVGLEWDALVQPSQSTRRAMHAVTEARPPLAVQPATPASAAAPKAVQTPPPAAPVQVRAEPPSAPPDQPVAVETPAAPQCDVDACAAAYRTFRASDCTYNSNSGRRLCTKGTAEVPDGAGAAPVAANCHIRACSESYSTFNPIDCTYQPLEGPRQLCKK
jgi:type IV secretory pathway VirB10-like protein